LERALVPSDLQISDSNYGSTLALYRCDECGFIFAEGSELRELSALYEQLNDPGYEDSQGSRALQMNWLLDRARAALPRVRSVLDVGAATGLLVHLARERGWLAEGVEPSRDLVLAAERLHGVQLLQGTVPHPALADRRFDVVFVVDVIEHVSDPVGLLRHASNQLAPGGILVVVTPDVGSWAQKMLRQRWWHFRLAHVGYFDVRSFEAACGEAQLRVVERQRAKWFFRVAYLAERITRYMPILGSVRRWGKSRLGQRLGNWVVPLNLFDSWVFVCRSASEQH